MVSRSCSELEGFTLGLVWQIGPCSAYDVRRHMSQSPSTQWSASAGAIYPVLRRLQKRGWVSVRAEKNHARRRRLYEISAAGLRALRGWVGPPFPPEAVTVSYDPLRSRARFLSCLNRKSRALWVGAADASLAIVEQNVGEWRRRYGPSAGPLADMLTRSGELDCESRRRWLRELRQALGRIGRPAPRSGGAKSR